jgi:hypothetical protein
MPSYLLLRSNKQLGPFSQEQLVQLGLKPYDLVWVEGKSAAWRYPSELPELKDYAPIIEEQPYDRFYKKKSEQKEEEPALAETSNVYRKPQAQVLREPKETVESTHERYMPKKAVSVIMPTQAAPVKKEEPVFIPAPAPAARIAEIPVETEIKYSQPLDEIKEMYVKQLQQRKHKTAQKKFILQSLKKAAVFAVIIGCGVLIGFVIKPKHSSKNIAANSTLQNKLPETAETPAKPEAVLPNGNNADATEITGKKQPDINSNPGVAVNESGSHPLTVPENKNNLVEKKKVNEEKDESLINQPSPETTINTTGSERNKKSRNANAENETSEKNIAVTDDILKSVSVKSNNYKVGTFGGFHNLELTVNNDSKFVLDNVMVELQYLKLSEQPVKIDHIRFQSIAPGGSLTIRIPDTKRGAKLAYKIIKIEPKDINANTAGL